MVCVVVLRFFVLFCFAIVLDRNLFQIKTDSWLTIFLIWKIVFCFPKVIQICYYNIIISTFYSIIQILRLYLQYQRFSSVQFSLSVLSDSAIPWIIACRASLSITNSWSLLKLTSIKSVMPSSHLILCRPLLLLPPIPPSIRVFSNESTLHMRWPKYWSFSFSIIPSKEHPGLISLRMDWLDLLAVQGTLKSLLQHHSSKASIKT